MLGVLTFLLLVATIHHRRATTAFFSSLFLPILQAAYHPTYLSVLTSFILILPGTLSLQNPTNLDPNEYGSEIILEKSRKGRDSQVKEERNR